MYCPTVLGSGSGKWFKVEYHQHRHLFCKGV